MCVTTMTTVGPFRDVYFVGLFCFLGHDNHVCIHLRRILAEDVDNVFMLAVKKLE